MLNSRPNLEIIFDGSKKIGLGHVKRSLTLFNILKEKVNIQMKGLSHEASQFIPSNHAGRFNPNIYLLDLPLYSNFYFGELKNKVIALDWFNSNIPDVNICIFEHAPILAKLQSYCSLDYIILRDEIRLFDKKKLKNIKNKIVVCLGGADHLGQSVFVAESLLNYGYDVTLIMGPFADKKISSKKYTVLYDPENFASELAEAEYVMTNGGGCLFEALFFEKYVLILPQTEMELRVASKLATSNQIIGVGIQDIKKIKTFNKRPFKKIINGDGVHKISEIILFWIEKWGQDV